MCVATTVHVAGQMQVDTSLTAEKLVDNVLVGRGIRVGNAECLTERRALGRYTCPENPVGIKSGVLLSTGYAYTAAGPNTTPGMTAQFSDAQRRSKGDRDLNRLTKGLRTQEVTIVEFDFIPMDNKVEFEYAFGSEEYTEYVGSRFNDVFGFFVSGPGQVKRNVALLPQSKKFVSINNVSQKNHKDLFVENDPFVNMTLYKNIKYKPRVSRWQRIKGALFGKRKMQGDSVLFYTMKRSKAVNKKLMEMFQFDGFTRKMTVEFYAEPYEVHHIKLAIGDVGDKAFDSGVFIEERSLVSFKDTAEVDFQDYVDKRAYFNFDSAFRAARGRIPPPDTTMIEEAIDLTQVLFDSDSYEVPDSSKHRMNELARFMLAHPSARASLVGFADGSGGERKNRVLSEKRAASIMYYLTGQGVGRDRLEYLGKSTEDPIGDNHTPEGRALNRRVEIELINE